MFTDAHHARSVSFVGWLVYSVPVLLPVFREHLNDNDGAVLPHPLMFQIGEWVEREVRAHGETDEVKAVIAALLVGYRDSDRDGVAGVVGLSFVEDLSDAPHPAAELRRFFR